MRRPLQSGRRRTPDRTQFLALGLLLFLSGAAALIYQLLWIKQLSLVVGVDVTLWPAGCKSVRVGGMAYTQCGPTYYTRVTNGYRVVVLN